MERIFFVKRELEEFFKWWNVNVNFLKVKCVEEIKNDCWEWVYDVMVELYYLFVFYGLVFYNIISIFKVGIIVILNLRMIVIVVVNLKFGRFNRYKSFLE